MLDRQRFCNCFRHLGRVKYYLVTYLLTYVLRDREKISHARIRDTLEIRSYLRRFICRLLDFSPDYSLIISMLSSRFLLLGVFLEKEIKKIDVSKKTVARIRSKKHRQRQGEKEREKIRN